MDHLLNLLKSNPPSGIPSDSLAQTGSPPSALSSYLTSTPWIIDSSASDHLASLSHLFKSYSPCLGNKNVRIADGSFSSIARNGQLKFQQKEN